MAHTYTIIYIDDKPIITKKRVKVRKTTIEEQKKLDAMLKKLSPLD